MINWKKKGDKKGEYIKIYVLYICKILTRIAVFWIFERNIWNIGNAIKFFIIEICIIICLKYDLNDLNDERKNSVIEFEGDKDW